MKFRLSIRLLLALTFFASICVAYYADLQRRIQRRLAAMSRIENDSGFLSFRQSNGGLAIDVTDDVRRNDRVESIYLAGSSLDDVTLENLRILDDVQFVSFNSSTFRDEHVAYLDSLRKLRELQLNGTAITRHGLERLAQKHSLTLLTLNDTSIDDESVHTLGAMKSLRKLYLRKTRITKDGFALLHQLLPQCKIER